MFKTEIDKDIFYSLIRNGQGFSKACLRLNFSVKEMGEYYERNEEFKKHLDNAFKLGLVDIASLREKALKDGKGTFIGLDEQLNKFIGAVHLWGCALNEFQREELEESGVIPITVDMIISGFELYGNLREVATAYQLAYDELLSIVSCQPELRKYLNIKQVTIHGKINS